MADKRKDFNQIIMPGITQWQGQGFFAYYPSRTSFPSILADFLTSAINPIGFSWVASPASTGQLH
jgi:glutamate/tyrosine decarboxylase-like PLP-dependent enzyme